MSDRGSERAAARPGLAAWKLPPIVAAITLPIVGGFYIGGPGLGMAVGALAAATIIVIAVRKPPLHPIAPPLTADLRHRILVVLNGPLDRAAVTESLLPRTGAAFNQTGPEIVLVAPCRQRFLDRWTSDVGPGREQARLALADALATLAGSGVEATAHLGDEGVVQAVEDELRSFPASEVVLVGGSNDDTEAAAVRALRARLRVPLRHLVGSEPLALDPAPARPARPARLLTAPH